MKITHQKAISMVKYMIIPDMFESGQNAIFSTKTGQKLDANKVVKSLNEARQNKQTKLF